MGQQPNHHYLHTGGFHAHQVGAQRQTQLAHILGTEFLLTHIISRLHPKLALTIHGAFTIKSIRTYCYCFRYRKRWVYISVTVKTYSKYCTQSSDFPMVIPIKTLRQLNFDSRVVIKASISSVKLQSRTKGKSLVSTTQEQKIMIVESLTTTLVYHQATNDDLLVWGQL